MPRSRRSEHPHAPEPRARTGIRRYASGVPWEAVVGYSRAVRAGPRIYVSGTTGTDARGAVVEPDDPYAQTVRALDRIALALEALGGAIADITRVRVFVRDMADFEAIARGLSERFDGIRPAATLVAVGGFVDPAMRVEIEADAEVGADRAPPRRSGPTPRRARTRPRGRGRRRPS
jgi:enamine deaminase RidA (YjgF/YER057c/UK114 family)